MQKIFFMTAKEQKIPKWIWNSIVLLFFVSILLIAFCIYSIPITERTVINIITIIGTVFGVVGIVIAIYQQIQLISVSNAIKNTTANIQDHILNIHFEVNINCASKCLVKIDECYRNDFDAKSLKIKLDDLHDHVIECRKIIEKYNNTHKEKSSNFADDSYDTFCEADRKIARFEYLILTTEFSILKFKEQDVNNEFMHFLVDFKRTLIFLKKIQYSL